MRTQLLCTFTAHDRLKFTVDLIIASHDVLFDKIYMFTNQKDSSQLICTYNIPNNQDNLTGRQGYNKWKKTMRSVAQEVGFKLINFKKQKEDEKAIKKAIAKDSTQTLKQQKKDEKDKVEPMGESFSKNWWKSLLTEGGAYGHMAHPFDDKDLTFGDLKKIITNGLGGKLSREDNVTEKLDGQNLMISWRED